MAHEICHLFALKHCVFFSCAMNGSNHLQESNNRPMFSCPICLHKLKSWFGFNMKERYQALLEFCSSVEDENVQGATIWLQKAIKELSWTFQCITIKTHSNTSKLAPAPSYQIWNPPPKKKGLIIIIARCRKSIAKFCSVTLSRK